MEEWKIIVKGGDFSGIGQQFGISPRLARLIRNKDVIGTEEIRKYLSGNISDLYDGMLLKDMDKALAVLNEKLDEGKRIRIIGDYDIDGVNATYILLMGLSRLGAAVDSDIPDRLKDGYGLNEELITRAYRDGVDTIITCDNGIAAAEAIRAGKNLGLTIIVTDHHEAPQELPVCEAVIDPKQDGDSYPFKELCGAAIAYKLAEALYEVRGRDADDLDDLLENVALATVGDVCDLQGENRILVREGLARLRRSTNPGLRALIREQGVAAEQLSAYHLGFVIGPCINAGGRLDTAKRSLNLLLAADEPEAAILAADLKALNDSRKELTEKAVAAAETYIQEQQLAAEAVYVIYLPDCHESLAGIVAGRIRETYQHPVLVLTDAREGLKGSGRSIPAYDMYAGLTQVSRYLTKFGGHKLAAGLSTKKEWLAPLRAALNAKAGLTEADFVPRVLIDMELPFAAITEQFIHELELLEPFGKGNEKPLFALRRVRMQSPRLIGRERDHLKMRLVDEHGTGIDALYFREGPKLLAAGRERSLDVAYYPQINEYQGRKSLQIVVSHYRIV